MKASLDKNTTYLITDTSWWMEMADRGWKVKPPAGSVFLIPNVVFRELDGLAKNKEKAQLARRAVREIAELAKERKARLLEVNRKERWDALQSKADEEIVEAGKVLKDNGYKVKLLTIDTGQRALAKMMGVETEVNFKERVKDENEVFKFFKFLLKGIFWFLMFSFLIVLLANGDMGSGFLFLGIAGGYILYRKWKTAREYNRRLKPKIPPSRREKAFFDDSYTNLDPLDAPIHPLGLGYPRLRDSGD